MKYALQVEKELDKAEILRRYLNMAPFGNGAYGVSAASQVYFGAKPGNLTVAQAALLAGMVKAPTSFDPTTRTGYPQALDRRNYIIDNMRDLGYLTPEAATKAKTVKLGKTTNRPGNGCRTRPRRHERPGDPFAWPAGRYGTRPGRHELPGDRSDRPAGRWRRPGHRPRWAGTGRPHRRSAPLGWRSA